MLTITDLYCGAGGSTAGAVMINNVVARVASNHWDRAIETHSANHPDTDHICLLYTSDAADDTASV